MIFVYQCIRVSILMGLLYCVVIVTEIKEIAGICRDPGMSSHCSCNSCRMLWKNGFNTACVPVGFKHKLKLFLSMRYKLDEL